MSGYKVCAKCGKLIRYTEQDTFWDESGCAYSTKLVKCKKCGTFNVLKYEDDSWLKNYSNTKGNYKRKKRGFK